MTTFNNPDQLDDFLTKQLDEAVRAVSLEAQKQMIDLTPVDTGNLRSNVFWADEGNGTYKVFNNQVYAERVYLEGHSDQLSQGEFQAWVTSIQQWAAQVVNDVKRNSGL